MGSATNATYRFLAKTDNGAATEILVASLDYPVPEIQDLALRALLSRKDPAGHREIFRRLPKMNESAKAIVSERPDRLANVAGSVISNPDASACETGRKAILEFRLYEAFPTVLSNITGEHPQKEILAQTVLELTEQFYADLSSCDDKKKHDRMDYIRPWVIGSLEDAARKYASHKSRPVMEAFLLVTKRKNKTLRDILNQPNSDNYKELVDILKTSQRGGIVRLLLTFLEEAEPPLAIEEVFASRYDSKFVEYYFKSITPEIPSAFGKTLAGMQNIEWAKPGHPAFEQFDDVQQDAAVRLIMASGMKRVDVLPVLEYLLKAGKLGGRRAAAKALADIRLPEAGAVLVHAIRDPDPIVRATLIRQLRQRNVPGAVTLMIRLSDSNHQEVRDALRDSLPEFTFAQLMMNFDSLPDAALHTCCQLVSKLDPEAVPKLGEEMRLPAFSRRYRAVQAACAMNLAPKLEEDLVRLLEDEEQVVRAAATKALGECPSDNAYEALRYALSDRSLTVREAAELSLRQIKAIRYGMERAISHNSLSPMTEEELLQDIEGLLAEIERQILAATKPEPATTGAAAS